ncbi:uncharacterized protein LOC130452854 [Diorhabda sublineata]|uniref:uncharacterized protein LOC130452854 n=1 Tax=Diorhabda sublineata TaxID=1163346 RepID=UPI0024E04CE1|nr:uncharacterized protein LOC130452854 [Diorhabda sublineata]
MSSRVILLLIITFFKLLKCLPSEEITTRYTTGTKYNIELIKKSTTNCSRYLTEPLKTILSNNLCEADSARKLKIVPSRKYNTYTTNKNITFTPLKLRTKIISTTPKSIKIFSSKITSATIKPQLSTVTKLIKNPIKNVTLSKVALIENSTKKKLIELKKRKPSKHKIVTKWKVANDLNDNKKTLYKQNIPIPNPNPEIISSSPPFSLSDVGQISPLVTIPNLQNDLNIIPEITSHTPPYSSLTGVPNLSEFTPVETIEPITNAGTPNRPLTTFKLDMLPSGIEGDSVNSPCPTVHISSSVLQPNERQGCSDLNLVINSHVMQSSDSNRLSEPITYDSIPETEDSVPLAQAVESEAVEAVETPAGQSVIPQSAGGTGGTGGTGGSGGSGSSGDGGAWKFPDLKHLFEALGYLWRGLCYVFEFLRNPYLYLIPMAIFFLLGFLKVMVLFPWWIPLLILYVSVKSATKQKPAVTFYKHVHKPVKHLDGWFWNHQTKTWENVNDYSYKRRNDVVGSTYDPNDSLTKDLQRIHQLYNGTTRVHKRRKS